MLRASITLVSISALLLSVAHAVAGPYAPAAGQPGSDAIDKLSPAIKGWATEVVDITRGPTDISKVGSPLASFGTPAAALGAADGSNVVSLGDGGSITLRLASGIRDAAGPDLAVFENSFSDTFLELGFVEVSSDGTHFTRFHASSLTPTQTQMGSFGLLDPTNLFNLAGKYRAGFGTPFDLSELAGSPFLDVSNVQYVRIVDVVGSINPAFATHDFNGNIVNDPWPTAFASGGFDLDAVAVLHAVPEPATIGLAAVALGVVVGIGRRRSARR